MIVIDIWTGHKYCLILCVDRSVLNASHSFFFPHSFIARPVNLWLNQKSYSSTGYKSMGTSVNKCSGLMNIWRLLFIPFNEAKSTFISN